MSQKPNKLEKYWTTLYKLCLVIIAWDIVLIVLPPIGLLTLLPPWLISQYMFLLLLGLVLAVGLVICVVALSIAETLKGVKKC